MKHFLLCVLLFFCSCALVFAQGGATGAINGTIEDSNAAAVPGADIRIIDQVSGNQLRTLVSDEHGTFTALLLPVGRHTIEVHAKGFAEQKATNVEVRVTETTRMKLTLQIGTVAQSIEVHSGVAVETTTAATGESIGAYVNINAFLPAPVVGPDGSTGYGDLGRNIFRGPFEQNWDFSIGKTFAFTENQRLEFRTEFFDLWNHPNFNNPSFVDVSGPEFGAITTMAGTPRVIQSMLRYGF